MTRLAEFLSRALLATFIAVFAHRVSAQESAAAPVYRDPDEGTLLAAPCAGCHRKASDSKAGIPVLSDLTPEELASKLLAYRSGELEGTLMNRLARGYSEAEIRLLADALGRPDRPTDSGS